MERIFFLLWIDCTSGDVRLAGGANFTEGLVEICLNNEWGTVCDQMWDATDAAVVCRQLHLGSTGRIKVVWRSINFNGHEN